MINNVIQWLRAGKEYEALELLSHCSLESVYVDTYFEMNGDREFDCVDVQIGAPREILYKVRGQSFPLADQIESAIKEWAQSENHVIRNISWVAGFSESQSPSAENVTAVLLKVDSSHIHRAWEKALDRRQTDTDGAITVARTLVETVCKHILDKEKVEYPNNIDLPQLYYLVATHLSAAPNQHKTKLARQILGNAQAVISGIAALRNELGDAHGKSSEAVLADEIYAELAVNLAGTFATYLLSAWEKARDQNNDLSS